MKISNLNRPLAGAFIVVGAIAPRPSAAQMISACKMNALKTTFQGSAVIGVPADRLRVALAQCDRQAKERKSSNPAMSPQSIAPTQMFDGSGIAGPVPAADTPVSVPMAAPEPAPSTVGSRFHRMIAAARGNVLRSDEVGIGVGKFLNNINSRLPGYVYSVEGVKTFGNSAVRVKYDRVEMSQLSADSSFTTVTFLRELSRWRYGIGLVAKTVYDPRVWWDPSRPDVMQQVGGDGHAKEYPNDGKHFSKSCSWCGVAFEAQYSLTRNLSVLATYMSVQKMSPTYNGTSVELVYALKNRAE